MGGWLDHPDKVDLGLAAGTLTYLKINRQSITLCQKGSIFLL